MAENADYTALLGKNVLSLEEPTSPSAPRQFAQGGPGKSRSFFDASRDMRFVSDSNLVLLDVNQAGVEIFQFESIQEMLQLESIDTLFAFPEDGRLLREKIEADGFVKEYDVAMKRSNGSSLIACITANLWYGEDGSISYKGVLQDVTELRHWQKALAESEEEKRQLSESEGRVRLLNEHILHMLMVMSHDIRGPLVALAATLKLLIRGVYGKMDKSVENTLGDLLSRAVQLLGIAEDCLGKAHLVEGSLNIARETIDLRQDIIDPVLDELSNEIEHNEISIDNRLGAIPAGIIPVNVNKVWLKAVFRNLFKNAIKYGGRGGNIAFGFEDHGTHYRLNVYNSGIPVPTEHRDKLFTKFFRGEGEGRATQDGVGLGLYLIKEIISKHGGDIWYEAKQDGSDFVFTIAKDVAQ